jgi:hypothetical protein
MRDLNGIKPQDVLVLLKMVVWEGKPYRLLDLSAELGLSQSEISIALERTMNAGLLDSSRRKPIKASLAEFLIHGLKYVFPAVIGPIDRGIPTAHSAPPLAKRIISQVHDQMVWPSPMGTMRGQTVSPLYESAPQAAQKDPQLYEWLALLDAVRLGRARERNIAATEIQKRLTGVK